MWQWTPAWGNLATVTVAIVAIAVSAWFNRRTLRRAAAQFSQQRRDDLNEALRKEIADLSSAVTARVYQAYVMLKQLDELIKSLEAEADSLSDDEIRERGLSGGRALLAQHILPVYNDIDRHATTVRMLTHDQEITGHAERITKAAKEEQAEYQKIVEDIKSGPSKLDKADSSSLGGDTATTIETARKELIRLGRERWGAD